MYLFQSTLPAGGSDKALCAGDPRIKEFQSTLPAGGATIRTRTVPFRTLIFQSTRPQGSDLLKKQLQLNTLYTYDPTMGKISNSVKAPGFQLPDVFRSIADFALIIRIFESIVNKAIESATQLQQFMPRLVG